MPVAFKRNSKLEKLVSANAYTVYFVLLNIVSIGVYETALVARNFRVSEPLFSEQWRQHRPQQPAQAVQINLHETAQAAQISPHEPAQAV